MGGAANIRRGSPHYYRPMPKFTKLEGKENLSSGSLQAAAGAASAKAERLCRQEWKSPRS